MKPKQLKDVLKIQKANQLTAVFCSKLKRNNSYS